MNLTNLIFWSVTIITGLAGAYNIDATQKAILKAQEKLIYESRTETWGSPRFFKDSKSLGQSHMKNKTNICFARRRSSCNIK